MQFDKTGLEAYTTDKEIEASQGVWLDFPGNRSILVLRAGGANKAFNRALAAAIRPYRRQFDRGTMDPEKQEEIMRNIYAQHIVKDWRGIKDEKGNDLPYLPSTAVAFFTAFPELFQEIVTFASEAATFSQKMLEEAADDMGESSNGI